MHLLFKKAVDTSNRGAGIEKLPFIVDSEILRLLLITSQERWRQYNQQDRLKKCFRQKAAP
jgi:hypothetical protein